MKKFLIFLVLSCSVILFSCSKNKMGVPADLSHIENLVVAGEWAVVTVPYAAFREEPIIQSKILAHSRRGDIFSVVGKFLQKLEENSQMVWYKFDQGWLLESEVSVFSNKLQAEYASSQF